MEFRNINVNIIRNEDITLHFDQEEIRTITLTKDDTDDLKEFFDDIFEFVVKNKVLVEFVLDDDTKDLFHDVSEDIVNQINSEIAQSSKNFLEIIGLLEN